MANVGVIISLYIYGILKFYCIKKPCFKNKSKYNNAYQPICVNLKLETIHLLRKSIEIPNFRASYDDITLKISKN